MEEFPYRAQLELPVTGIEAEFKVFLDDREVVPETVWRTPAGFIDQPLLKRTSRSLQLPTGGAVYFDGGVIEIVTPVIEIAPHCTARVVRSAWEQIGFVRDQLDQWEVRNGSRVRLQAFSTHYNISFEIPRDQRSSNRTVQKLAFLLAHILPVPVMVAGANRRSTGIGVRPRRERIEMTLDFTPDPALMAATAAVIVGITRDVIAWPSYLLDEVDRRGVPRLIGVEPGKHPSRNGWVVRDYHFPKNPYAAHLDADRWETTRGPMSLRQIALATAKSFDESIRRHADPFSCRVLAAVLSGETPALLDLDDRPAEYDDVGRNTRWESVLPDRRGEKRGTPERRGAPLHPPSSNLTRSEYEKVFLRLASRRQLVIEGERLTPVKVKGWYHSVFKTDSGEERLLTLDQILASRGHWL